MQNLHNVFIIILVLALLNKILQSDNEEGFRRGRHRRPAAIGYNPYFYSGLDPYYSPYQTIIIHDTSAPNYGFGKLTDDEFDYLYTNKTGKIIREKRR